MCPDHKNHFVAVPSCPDIMHLQTTLLQTTALMGAHTIGACNRSNSGYAGTWITGGARAFDNEYYKVMLDDSSSTSWIIEVRADILS